MRKTDTHDVLMSVLAVAADAAAVFGAFLLATWIRFDSGWLPPPVNPPPPALYTHYAAVAAVAALLYLLTFRSLGLFIRPQTGSFVSKIPRLIRGAGIGTLLTAVGGFALQNEGVDIARIVIALAFVCMAVLLPLERWILFRVERHSSKHSESKNNVLILGTDSVAAHVLRTIKREHMLRARVVGFLRTDDRPPDPGVPADLILGAVEDIERCVEERRVHQVIVTNAGRMRDRIVELVLLCERNLIAFNMVPDLFQIMTSSMDVQSLDDIPLLGISRWPLDFFWNRCLKRAEDLAGSAVGLILVSPVIALAALAVKATSRGPALFRQERCGHNGSRFSIWKLRTMRVDAEVQTGPVFASENDPRTTPVGAFLRRWNLDELPQLLNVLKGDMSLVGPRPERPHFVEKFREDIDRYMQRHVSKPGMTGWAQVNGLRGNTSIEERVKYDLYYLENWSLTFDFKILLRTVTARQNAY
jgi:exopolysaccharide biosynthesis polyprenyl glycosylphosphotransferase